MSDACVPGPARDCANNASRLIDHEIEHPSGQTLTVYEMPATASDLPTILLLHGLGATFWLNWKPLLESLSREYRVLGIDHRGHGRGLDSSTCRFEDCADDIAIALEALDVDQVTVAAYSMGGPIALQFWRRHPAKVAGLLLSATATSLTHLKSAKFYLVLPVLFLTSVYYHFRRGAYLRYWTNTVQKMFPGRFTDAELVKEFSGHRPMTLYRAVLNTAGFEIDWGGEIDVPVVCLVTMGDEVVPPARQLATAMNAKHGTSVETPGGHQSILAEPGQFLADFSEACRQLRTILGKAR